MLDRIRVDPGSKPHLAKRDAGDHLGLESKKAALAHLDKLRARLEKLQGRLSVTHYLDIVTLSLEVESQALGEILLVFNDQDPAHS